MEKLRIPSSIYMGIFNLLSIAALFYLIKLRNISAASVFAGSLLFIASDTILALKYFSQKACKASGSAILITYALAQLFIVAGLSIQV